MFDESFWLAICITGFILLILRPLKGALLNFLDERVKSSRERFEKYQLQNQEAQELLHQATIRLKKAKTHHQEILMNTQQEIKELRETRMAEIDHSLIIRRTEFQHTLAARTERAQSAVYLQLIQTATALVKQYFNIHSESLPSTKEIINNLYNSKSQDKAALGVNKIL